MASDWLVYSVHHVLACTKAVHGHSSSRNYSLLFFLLVVGCLARFGYWPRERGLLAAVAANDYVGSTLFFVNVVTRKGGSGVGRREVV